MNPANPLLILGCSFAGVCVAYVVCFFGDRK